MFPFQRLTVWQRAHNVGVALIRARVGPLRADPLVAEAIRSAISVVSNIAEGAGSDSPAQCSRYLGIARASAHELEAQLLLGRDSGVLSSAAASVMIDQTVEVRRMLIALQRRVAAQRAGSPR